MANLITGQNENSVIFLLGSGASVDAGMPKVDELTKELKDSLSTLSDVNGNQQPEFAQVFDLFEKNSGSDVENYEKFFEWIKAILEVQKTAFQNVIHTNIAPLLIDAMWYLRSEKIGAEVARLLFFHSTQPSYLPSYLARLGDFMPNKGRLKVFTLNYDCCVEDACENAGIDITTGFNPVTKKWDPCLFKKNCRGINLYKLHSSLRWFPVKDNGLSPCKLILMELTPDEHRQFSTDFRIPESPELILGPGNKVQSDDPFLTLLYEFRKSMLKAKMCVIIGFGYGDPHIRDIIDEAVDMKVPILNVNSRGPTGRYFDVAHYQNLQKPAKDALLDGSIARYMLKLVHSCKDSECGNGATADSF